MFRRGTSEGPPSPATGRRASVIGLLAAGMLALLPASALAEVPSTNLLQNAGAEEGSCAEESAPPVTIPHWTASGGFTVLCYASGVTLDPSTAELPTGEGLMGKAYFMGGAESSSTATQTVDVSPYAADIDGSNLSADLSGWLGGWLYQDDSMTVVAAFLNGSGTELGTALQIGPVLAAERNGLSTLVERSATGNVPVGTRSIRVTMSANRVEGSDNDGSADLLQLRLSVSGASPLIPPNFATALYNGRALYIRLKCPARFKPSCLGREMAITARHCHRRHGRRHCRGGKPISRAASAKQKPGSWKVVVLRVKRKYRKLVARMATKPNKKTLIVRQVLHAKRFRHGRHQVVFHRYEVRRSG